MLKKNNKSDSKTNNKNLISKAIIPFDTKKLNIRNIDNFYLKFHKLPIKPDKNNAIKIGLENIGSDFNNLNIKNISEQYLVNIQKMNLDIKYFQYETDGRLAVDLGSESVYETSICLHYIYGFPYIPGQAIKGVLRNHIINEVFNGKEVYALKNNTFCRLFGCNEKGSIDSSVGNVYFFDAYPINSPTLKLDVMNPHYSSYYKDETNKVFPVDYDDTIPINFITVEHTKFRFIVGFKKNLKTHDGIEKCFNETVNNLWDETQKEFLNKSVSEIVCKYLKEALEEKGLGAKTSIGYGYFNIDKEEEKRKKN
ncbi:type III-B CRISPR module RAMP protein Cmr6 [Clostridium botulinum]|uniref:type III-B CRISPR module RAMP protein Cmr6 n=1 Tax=Clostridium botulinum TaxID=1491 RepID=UPI0019683838|nr:type III-B CRISPR module RAMP protein Cmr6 [Clostridium botulinum]